MDYEEEDGVNNLISDKEDDDSNNTLEVQSSAGSGKTTLNLFIASQIPRHQVLLLVYNKALQLDTWERAQKMNFDTNINSIVLKKSCIFP